MSRPDRCRLWQIDWSDRTPGKYAEYFPLVWCVPRLIKKVEYCKVCDFEPTPLKVRVLEARD